ncbi:MAG: sigma-E processing peptidase SpoIIGA [Ruminococcus sp.]
MRTIYIDVLLILNLYVNWFLLKGTARVTHTRLTSFRCFLAAALGSLTSLAVFLPVLPLPVSIGIKLACSAVPVGAAFAFMGAMCFLRCLFVFLTLSFAFAGFMLAVCSASGTDLLIWSGSCIYLHFSLTALILCTSAAYFLLRVFSWVKMRFCHSDEIYEVIIRIGTHTAKLKGIADTGNSLTDCFTGKAVVIFGKESLSSIPEIEEPEKLHGYRLLPYSTVSGSGIMPVFCPDEIIIKNVNRGTIHSTDALAVLAEGEKSAIFSPKLL